MAVTGARLTSNVAATQRVVDLHKPILLLDPDSAPLCVISQQYYNGAREKARDKKFTWHNDKLWTRWDAVNNGAGYTSGNTSIVVDNGTRFTKDDLVKVPRTGEVMIVDAVSTNTLTVRRSAGAVAAAALVDDDPLYIIATAAEENALPRTARSENPVVETNYTEIFKRTTQASATWLSSSNESSPHDWPHQVRKDMIEHQVDKELAFLFGSPGIETGITEVTEQTVTGGLTYFMTSNAQAAGGAWTLPEIETFIRTITRHGSKKKTFFCGRLVASVLSEHALDKLQVIQSNEGNNTTFGVTIKRWVTANGEIKIISHPLMEGVVYDSMGIAVDFASQAIGYRYLAGEGPGGARDTHVNTNIQEPGRDGRRDEVLAECGLRVGLPETGGIVTGVTSSA